MKKHLNASNILALILVAALLTVIVKTSEAQNLNYIENYAQVNNGEDDPAFHNLHNRWWNCYAKWLAKRDQYVALCAQMRLMDQLRGLNRACSNGHTGILAYRPLDARYFSTERQMDMPIRHPIEDLTVRNAQCEPWYDRQERIYEATGHVLACERDGMNNINRELNEVYARWLQAANALGLNQKLHNDFFGGYYRPIW